MSVFLVVVVLYMAGVSQLVCLSFGAVSGTLAVWLTFRMNARYGEHGLMKMLAENAIRAICQPVAEYSEH